MMNESLEAPTLVRPPRLWHPGRKLRLGLWSVRAVDNWPELFAWRLMRRTFDRVRLRNGVQIHFNTASSEVRAFLEVYFDRVYTPPVAVPATGTILDIGANCGSFSLLAATELVPHGRVIALEPNPDCLRVIQRSLTSTRLTNVETLAGAVGVGTERAEFNLNPDGSGHSSLYGAGTSSTIEVVLHPPRSILRLAETVDFMKIDCEGGEHCLVWETNPADWSGVRSLALEYHLGMGTGYPSDRDPRALAQRLVELGMRIDKFIATSSDLGYIVATRRSVAETEPRG